MLPNHEALGANKLAIALANLNTPAVPMSRNQLQGLDTDNKVYVDLRSSRKLWWSPDFENSTEFKRLRNRRTRHVNDVPITVGKPKNEVMLLGRLIPCDLYEGDDSMR